jgi:hypothetical protein
LPDEITPDVTFSLFTAIEMRGGADVTCTAVLITQPARSPSAAALTTYRPLGIVKNAVLSITITPLAQVGTSWMYVPTKKAAPITDAAFETYVSKQ